MTDLADVEGETGKKGRGGLLMIALPVLLLGAGFGTTYLGLWSPLSLFAKSEAEPAAFAPTAVFVDLPTIVTALPGGRGRSVVLSAKIETDAAHQAQVQYLQPRILDAFNTFLADIDPAAFERRGILDILRAELTTRLGFILGDKAFSDLLITEFRIQ
ncbi:flagellar basal body-associated FliL family protein [Paracoccus aminophilus]|uniref:Flagellar protein FliL n=1 Tax=Paracoccus aminophilus JCM 7686 TaxID=1367847 RepID=S5XQV0_PARAH|nr:flagellar basal body-associated FliL family protein [Paracoccus aminophilus]AGT07447.1 flagellar basal body-associated protein FliL [Paracoccus aminophilus JCM 7686]